jgi:GntR family transcriptional regulator
MIDPRYRQIANDLQLKIDAGRWAPGERLPTELELSDQYNASRNTIRDAVKLLTTRGKVETRLGQGTFVVEKIDPFVTTLTTDAATGLGGGEGVVYIAEASASGRKAAASDPVVELQRAPRDVARSLGIQEGDPVISRHQRRTIDGIPYSLQTTWYPRELATRGATRLLDATDITEGTVTYLREVLGITQVGYRDSIAVRPPDQNEITYFQLPSDGRTAVFSIFRVAFDQEGYRFRITITTYPADRNRFVINVGELPDNV